MTKLIFLSLVVASNFLLAICEETRPLYTNHIKRCDGIIQLIDGSDEKDCPCLDNQFSCKCNQHPGTCSKPIECIHKSKVNDGEFDCSDKSDETSNSKHNITCGACLVSVRRLSNKSECQKIGTPLCDVSTCTPVRDPQCTSHHCDQTNVICTSSCKDSPTCQKAMLCADNSIILASQFCNGVADCADGSDEVYNKQGFKCMVNDRDCVVPQQNVLQDNVPPCYKSSDVRTEENYFVCLDERLVISSEQVCDNVIDCFDFSDECLCHDTLYAPICKDVFNSDSNLESSVVGTCSTETKVQSCSDISSLNVNTATCNDKPGSSRTSGVYIRCENKFNNITAVMCDGRPECKDFSDECYCENPPAFCSDDCHLIYSMGDRYCDGYIDESWLHINDSRCPEGFDEMNCPKRRKCKAGNKMSIDESQWCNGKKDCDDGRDESNCTSLNEDFLSSDTEILRLSFLRVVIWIIAVVTITGNIYVFCSTAHSMRISNDRGNIAAKNNILILSLSLADFLMGIYLVTIAVKGVQYSGIYGQVDAKWRSSVTCSVAGIFAVISSQASCFTMVLLSGFRLHSVLRIFSKSGTFRVKVAVAAAWLISILLAIIPVLPYLQPYFIHELWFNSQFSKTGELWGRKDLTEFSCRYIALSNLSVQYDFSAFADKQSFLEKYFPQYSLQGAISYYGETSVCMPRLFVVKGGSAWEYTAAIITTNFICFLFILLPYLYIYKHSSKRIVRVRNVDKQNKQMQKRVARLVITDFCCWIPICFLAYLRLAGLHLEPVAYALSGVVLFPINSALNPILYSSYIEKTMQGAFERARSTVRSTRGTQEFSLPQ